MKIIYKLLETGKIQQWSCIQDGDSFYVEEGIQGGKITKNKPTKCFEKNVGKKNYINAKDQCAKEIQAKYTLKLKSGYFSTVEECLQPKRFEVMLAETYQEVKNKIKFPALHDNKLDGMRCYITKDGLFSRLHNPIQGVPHIWDAIKVLYAEGDPEMIFDGELYNHELKDDFNKIVSCIKKSTNLTPEILAESKKYIQFHCYDYYNKNHPNLTCTERRSWLKTTLQDIPFTEVPSLVLCSNQKHLDIEFEKAKSLGYEGQIIRENVSYQQKRTISLIKRKDFIDEEFEIIGSEEGKGNRQGGIGKFIMKTKDGKTFEADMAEMGGLKVYEEMWKVKDSFIGKMATVVYQKLTPRGVPKFGKVKSIRDYE